MSANSNRIFDRTVHKNGHYRKLICRSSSYKVKRNHQGDHDHVHDKRPHKKINDVRQRDIDLTMCIQKVTHVINDP